MSKAALISDRIGPGCYLGEISLLHLVLQGQQETLQGRLLVQAGLTGLAVGPDISLKYFTQIFSPTPLRSHLLAEAKFAGRLPVDVGWLVDAHEPGASDVVSEADAGQAQCDLALATHCQLSQAQVESNHQVFLPGEKNNNILILIGSDPSRYCALIG